MPERKAPTFPLRLTPAQRRAVAGLLPELAPRLALDGKTRTLQFTLAEIKEIATKCTKAVPKAATGMERNSLRHVVATTEQAVMQSQGI
ncbi:MAG: hypothetical protein U1E05_04975, partial [Patescibacteria group bacterium]|nr:hypothetical protein [Patescibacteria group bacterium]